MLFDKRIIEVNDLINYLKQNNANQIVIIGLMVGECLYESLLADKEPGYNMYLISKEIVGKLEKTKIKVISKLKQKEVRQLTIREL